MDDWVWSGKSLPSKKNSKKIGKKKDGKPCILSSDEYMKWEEEFVRDIRSLGYSVGRWKSAVFTFYAPTRIRFDLSNKLESVMDGLVRARYIDDDDVSHCPDNRTVFGGLSDDKLWRVSAEIVTE